MVINIRKISHYLKKRTLGVLIKKSHNLHTHNFIVHVVFPCVKLKSFTKICYVTKKIKINKQWEFLYRFLLVNNKSCLWQPNSAICPIQLRRVRRWISGASLSDTGNVRLGFYIFPDDNFRLLPTATHHSRHIVRDNCEEFDNERLKVENTFK